VLDPFVAGDLRESGNDRAGRLELRLGDAAVQLHVCAEAQHLALSPDRPAATLDEQAHRVRADVDNPDRHR